MYFLGINTSLSKALRALKLQYHAIPDTVANIINATYLMGWFSEIPSGNIPIGCVFYAML